jgi:hypothetical protein
MREVQKCIGIHDAHKPDISKIQALSQHLSTHQDIRFPGFKCMNDTLKSIFPAGCIQIHPGRAGLWEQIPDFLLYLFRSKTLGVQCEIATSLAFLLQGLVKTAIVATEFFSMLMIRKADIAVATSRSMPAAAAFHNRGKSATVLEEDYLLFSIQSFLYDIPEPLGEMPFHLLFSKGYA